MQETEVLINGRGQEPGHSIDVNLRFTGAKQLMKPNLQASHIYARYESSRNIIKKVKLHEFVVKAIDLFCD